MDELELAIKYQPYVWTDKMEPFEVIAVGYTIFRNNCRSQSFPKRLIKVDWEKIDYVIEYAVWFDFDIQHLYDLEHLWVYVDKNGNVINAEGSFHGKYLRMAAPDTGLPVVDHKTHIQVYCQPGKHAFLPAPELFQLITDWKEACCENAGSDGVLVQEMYRERIKADQVIQEAVRNYIQEQFAFMPSMSFEKKVWQKELFITWPRLSESIPDRVNTQISVIMKARKGIQNDKL
jgi:hypothetical protein